MRVALKRYQRTRHAIEQTRIVWNRRLL